MNFRSPPEPANDVFRARRDRVVAALGEGALILGAAPIQYASRDAERPYWPDRELYYLTGLSEPGTVAVLTASDPQLVVFARDRDADAELWSGPRLGPEGAGERSGADAAFPLSELESELPGVLRSSDRIFTREGKDPVVDRVVREALEYTRARGARTGTGPRGVIDPGVLLDDLRLVKDAVELDAIRTACRTTVGGHRAGAAAIRPDLGEWVVESAVDGEFLRNGARGPAFETIVGSGANGCVLHYVENSRVIESGDLVLIDAGANVGMYHGDVTRTYPANGTFTGPQRDIYQLVDSARKAGIEAVRPGARISDVHDASTRVLVAGLLDLGVLSGDPDQVIDEGGHKLFYPHQTSHWLGLDVHDVGDYATGGSTRLLTPGMVLTVEPGLYFRAGAGNSRAEDFAGTGIRIEDDVAVTEEGHDVLTADLPTDVADVEALVGS